MEEDEDRGSRAEEEVVSQRGVVARPEEAVEVPCRVRVVRPPTARPMDKERRSDPGLPAVNPHH